MQRYKVELDKVRHLFKKSLPKNIVEKIYYWAKRIEIIGLEEARKISGFHDEPLKGIRTGQRSVRLNLSYRLFYVEDKQEKIIIVKVIEVNKHEY